MDVGYTRQMEAELDKIEDEHHDWVTMLREFYGPFKESLDRAHGSMTHAKAEIEPAPASLPQVRLGDRLPLRQERPVPLLLHLSQVRVRRPHRPRRQPDRGGEDRHPLPALWHADDQAHRPLSARSSLVPTTPRARAS